MGGFFLKEIYLFTNNPSTTQFPTEEHSKNLIYAYKNDCTICILKFQIFRILNIFHSLQHMSHIYVKNFVLYLFVASHIHYSSLCLLSAGEQINYRVFHIKC